MPVSVSSIYRTRDEILDAMIQQLVSAIPDVYVGQDGVIRIIFDIEAGQFESLYLAEQLLLEDMFVSTASYQALARYGDEYGLQMGLGTNAQGTLMFEGEDGAFIPQGTLAAYDPGNGIDPISFQTMSDTTVPAPGDPDAPHATPTNGGGNLTGAYEYIVTFLTSVGETLPSVESNIVTVNAGVIDLTLISIGGPMTERRRIYRDVNGAGNFRLVQELADNTTVGWHDNVSDASIANAQTPPTVDTAHRTYVTAQCVEIGITGNVAIGMITEIADGPPTLTSVTNTTAFTGGSDVEDSESFRARLLSFIQNPQTGSVNDIQAWALNVPGVETAAVIENTPVNGTVTVRITGPNGSIPDQSTIDAVQTSLDALDYANITIIVQAFTPLITDVSVDITLTAGYTIDAVTPSVQAAIEDYINNLQTGETLRVAGIIDAVFGLDGVDDVVMVTPTSNQTTAADTKRIPGTITVS